MYDQFKRDVVNIVPDKIEEKELASWEVLEEDVNLIFLCLVRILLSSLELLISYNFLEAGHESPS